MTKPYTLYPVPPDAAGYTQPIMLAGFGWREHLEREVVINLSIIKK
jgi:hypothetical protein